VPSSPGGTYAFWKSVIGFITGFILTLVLLSMIQGRAEQEIILDFTTAPAITAPASAKDSDLLLSFSPRRACTLGSRRARAAHETQERRAQNACPGTDE
jgi:hypothetical protein